MEIHPTSRVEFELPRIQKEREMDCPKIQQAAAAAANTGARFLITAE